MTEYFVRCDGYDSETFEAADANAARAWARRWLRDGDWSATGRTIWVRAHLFEAGSGDSVDQIQVRIDPPEPKCTHADGHDWQSPYALVGGLRENPGVHGHGGGVIIREVCMHCGCGRMTDTWAQDPSTGEQGLESVAYEPGQYTDELGSGGGLRLSAPSATVRHRIAFKVWAGNSPRSGSLRVVLLLPRHVGSLLHRT